MDLTRNPFNLGLPYLPLLPNSTFPSPNVSNWLCLPGQLALRLALLILQAQTLPREWLQIEPQGHIVLGPMHAGRCSMPGGATLPCMGGCTQGGHEGPIYQ